MDAEADTAAANLNFVGAYQKLVEHVDGADMRAFGRVIAFTTGLAIPIFNGVILLERALPVEVERALDWVAGLGVPYRMWVREELASDVRGLAEEEELEADAWRSPGMVLSPVPPSPDPQPGVSVRGVEDLATLADYRRAQTDGDVPEELARRLSPPSLIADHDVQVFTGYLDGRPVGTSIAIRTGAVSGVYNVGTLPEARRRGVGTALTWAAVGAGRDWGCEPVVLDSSDIGEPIYSAMGFRTVTRYVIFKPSSAAKASAPPRGRG